MKRIKEVSRVIVFFLSTSLFLFSCTKENNVQEIKETSQLKATVTENFESGTKTAYAAASVTLATGSWNFNDALIGNLSTDRKNG